MIARLPALALAAVCAGACAHRTGAGAEPETPGISLSESAPGEWRASYRLTEPAPSLRFARNPDDSRSRRWRVEAGFEILHRDGADFLQRTDGAGFREASLTAPARYVQLPKDYAPFSPFTDGGLLIHSGQFQVCAGPAECADDAEWSVSVTPPDGAHVIVNGEVHHGPVAYADAGDGTNLYVGAATPLETSHFIAVIDTGLPRDVSDALNNNLPRLMDYFADRLGPLQAKPMLFASLDPAPPKQTGYSSQGGTLPNQIFIHLYGSDWRDKAAGKIEGFLPWFFAHEAAHLFQSVGRRDGYNMDQSWIHEGGADAFAALALRRLGAATPDYLGERIVKALDACASGLKALGGKPLNASAKAGAFGNYYTCGLLAQLAIDAEVKAASLGKLDLFDVWSLFLSRVRAGAPWDQEEFLDAAKENGASSSLAFARALAENIHPDAEAFLRAGLTEAGFDPGG